MPLIYSVDRLAGKEAQTFEKRITHRLTEKWGRHYSTLRGYVRGRMSLSVVHSNALLLRGSRVARATRFTGQDGTALAGLKRMRN